MATLLLVDPAPGELSSVRAAVPGFRPVPVSELSALLDEPAVSLDAVVLGVGAPTPAALVQQVHAADPAAAVAVLTDAETHAEVRRTLSYAPGVPSGLLVLDGEDPRLGDRLRDLVDAARAERRHRTLLAAVSEHHAEQPSRNPLPRSLGTLLHNAPFGVLVADVEGRLIGWNPWADDLLGLGQDSTGQSAAEVFTDPEPLLAALELARGGRLAAATPGFVLQRPGETAFEVSVVPTELEDGQPAVLLLIQDVTERRRAETTRDRLAAHVGLLAQVSEALAGMLDADEALRRLAQQVVPVLGDWVSLQILDTRGNPRRVALHHRDPARQAAAEAVQRALPETLSADAPSRRIARGDGPVLHPTMTASLLERLAPEPTGRRLLEELGVGSVIAVPLPGRDRVLGSMVLVKEPSSRAFTEEELAVASEVGRRAGVTLETISLYAQQSALAGELQRSLLSEPPASDHAEIVARYLAAAREAQVGGDWYDAFLQESGAVVLVIGDVIGHDTRAAAAMGQIRALLRGIGYTTATGPAEMLSRLDAAMEGLDVRTTATAVAMRIDPETDAGSVRRLRWSNAGHPPPVLLTPTGAARILQAEDSDLLLGVVADAPRREGELLLEPGATLLLYTDGLVERRGQGLDEGLAALLAAVDSLSGLPLEELCDRLLERMLPDELEDDVALLGVRLA